MERWLLVPTGGKACVYRQLGSGMGGIGAGVYVVFQAFFLSKTSNGFRLGWGNIFALDHLFYYPDLYQ